MADLDLASLTCWERRVEVAWAGQTVPVLLRIAGERQSAVEAGCRRMEQELATWAEGSARRRALLQLLAARLPEELLEEALAAERPALERQVERELPDPPLQRDAAGGESEAEFAGRRACWQREGEGRAAARRQRLESLLTERRRALSALPPGELAARILPGRIQQAGWEAFEEGAMAGLLCQACRRPEPPHEPCFTSPEQVLALLAAVRAELAQAYRALDPGLAGDLPKG